MIITAWLSGMNVASFVFVAIALLVFAFVYVFASDRARCNDPHSPVASRVPTGIFRTQAVATKSLKAAFHC
jgi:hypothetical protein